MSRGFDKKFIIFILNFLFFIGIVQRLVKSMLNAEC